jgi:hypothetical protein
MLGGMTLLAVRIVDSRNESVEVRTLGDWHRAFPVDIGSSPECRVRLDAPAIAPLHVRYFAQGHHRFIDILDPDVVVRFGTTLRRKGEPVRVDYRPFYIGPYEVNFEERQEP